MRTQWLKGTPPRGPRSYSTVVSPPLVKRTPYLATPGLRSTGEPQGATYANGEFRNLTWKATSKQTTSGDSWASKSIQIGARDGNLEGPKLRETFKPLERTRADSRKDKESWSSKEDNVLGHSPLPHTSLSSPTRAISLNDRESGSSEKYIPKESIAPGRKADESGVETSDLPKTTNSLQFPELLGLGHANSVKLSRLPLSLATSKAAQDDVVSLRSDGTTSSGLGLSGRSSTTSRSQTTRCYACKDTKIAAEHADRLENLEKYVECRHCHRRYHTRCARGYIQ